MKHIKKLATLILIIILTIPKIVEIYKQIYTNYIKQREIVEDKARQMVEADIKIKTNYVDEPKEYDDTIKNRFKRQWNSLRRLNNER